jgi:hypothetical protein
MSTSTARSGLPVTWIQSAPHATSQPIRSRIFTNWTSPCFEPEPMPRTRAAPPVAAAIARK